MLEEFEERRKLQASVNNTTENEQPKDVTDYPYYVIYNPKGLAAVTIDRRIVGDEYANAMVERFKKSNHPHKAVTEKEYQQIRAQGNFAEI